MSSFKRILQQFISHMMLLLLLPLLLLLLTIYSGHILYYTTNSYKYVWCVCTLTYITIHGDLPVPPYLPAYVLFVINITWPLQFAVLGGERPVLTHLIDSYRKWLINLQSDWLSPSYGELCCQRSPGRRDRHRDLWDNHRFPRVQNRRRTQVGTPHNRRNLKMVRNRT